MRPLRQYLPEYKAKGAVPARAAVGNLVWTHGGSVLGIWRVEPVAYKYLSHAGKLAYHESVRSTLLALPPESTILSVCPPLDHVGTAMAVLKGHENRASWQQVAAESVDLLHEWDPFERWFYVVAHLGSTGGFVGEIKEQMTSVLRRPFGRPMEHDVRAKARQAQKLEADLRRSGRTFIPVGAGEARWIYARALRRGIRDVPLLGADRREIQTPGFASVGGVVTLEGGDRKDYGRGLRRPYLRVAEPSGDGPEAVGYQCHIALADMPEGTFPDDYEILYALDDFGFPVDWAIQMHRTTNALSRQHLAKKSKALVQELGGEGRAKEIEDTGQVPAELQEAWDALLAHRERLIALKSEGNVRATIALTVWGRDLRTAQARADAVVEALAPNEWGLARPPGGQSGLLELGMPGGRTAVVAYNYEQTLLPTDIAALGLFAGSDIGDDTGFLVGARMDCKTNRPVLWEPAGGLHMGQSSSAVFIGVPGSGKSLSAKRSMHEGVLARGGRGISIDRTPQGEWVRFADAMREEGFSTSVVTTDEAARSSFDPFRVFADAKDQKKYALGLYLLVTQTPSSNLSGICLSDAVEEVSQRDASERSSPAVLGVLEQMFAEGRHGAEEAFYKLRAFVRGPYGRMAFDPDSTPANLTADFVVFHVPDLELPDRETMRDGQLASQLLPEQLGALGVFYLIAAAGRAIILADRDRFSVLCVDEAWVLTSTVQGVDLLETTERDGRKRYAAVWLITQHPDDVSDPKLSAFLITRFVYAQGQGAGPGALAFLNLEPTPALVEKVQDGLSRNDRLDADPEPARCMMLDARRRVGEIVWNPPSERLMRAYETNQRRLSAYGPAPVDAGTNGHAEPAELVDYEVTR